MKFKKIILLLVINLFFTGVFGQYCTPTSQYGPSYGDYIDGVTLGTINNINTGSAAGPSYNDYTSLSTNLSLNNNYTISIKSGPWQTGYADYYAVWIDYNHDGNFNSGEKLGEFLSSAPLTTQSINFTVPSSAVIGTTRMRVRCVWSAGAVDPCINYSYDEIEDYSVNILSAVISYCSITSPYGTTSGDFIDGVTLGTINNLNTGSATGPAYTNYTSMSANINKSSAYTLYIKSGAWPAGYPDYYAAWIDYNKDGDFMDAGEKLGEFLSTANATTQNINFTVPSGATAITGTTRMRVRGVWSTTGNIDPCAAYNYGETEDYSVNIQSSGVLYCSITSSTGTTDGDYINGVAIGTIRNFNTGSATGTYYNDYTTKSTDLVRGSFYRVHVESGMWNTSFSADYYAAWIDFNHDGDFSDAGEKLGEFLSSGQVTDQSIYFNVPSTATVGVTTMRIRGVWSSTANIDPCLPYTYGETEDYSVNILSKISSYCTIFYYGGTGNGDYIDGVSLGSINNMNTGSSSGTFYYDYTSMSTNIAPSSTYTVNIKSGNWVTTIQYYAAWIDYNHDGDFVDSGEKLGEFASSGPLTTENINFTVPASATTGATIMRIRGVNRSSGGLDPCSEEIDGETEDYTVNIQTTTGINETTQAAELSIYPNPNAGKFTLSINSPTNSLYSVCLINAIGQELIKKEIKIDKLEYREELNLSSYADGIYYLLLRSPENTISRKILISK